MKNRCRPCSVYQVFIFLLLLSQTALSQQRTVTIGLVIDGPWEHNEEIRKMTEEEILALSEGEFDVRFPEGANGARSASKWKLVKNTKSRRRALKIWGW